MRLLVGDDWAAGHHDVEVMDAAGRALARVRKTLIWERARRLRLRRLRCQRRGPRQGRCRVSSWDVFHDRGDLPVTMTAKATAITKPRPSRRMTGQFPARRAGHTAAVRPPCQTDTGFRPRRTFPPLRNRQENITAAAASSGRRHGPPGRVGNKPTGSQSAVPVPEYRLAATFWSTKTSAGVHESRLSRTAALAAYDQLLREELGVSPCRPTQTLHAWLLRGQPLDEPTRPATHAG